MKLLPMARDIWTSLLPASARRAVGHRLHPLKLEYWRHAIVAAGTRPGAGPPAIVGFFSGASGIALSAQLASRALDRLGIEHRTINITDPVATNDVGSPSASAWLFYLNPPELIPVLYRWGPKQLAGPRYGYWAWELPVAPPFWVRAAVAVEGLLVPSRYTADAFRRASTPVTVTPHPVFVEDFAEVLARRNRSPGTPFRVISLFDFRSSAARKNPLAALDAFMRAFGDDPGARLIVKTQNACEAPELLRLLHAKAGRNVEFIDAVWERPKVLAFIAAADAIISLHRAEGFGLTLAEAMTLGVPVVATAWSGNLDFMTDNTACLTPARIVPVEDTQGIYKGQAWADPDVSVAAQYLLQLKGDPISARAQAERAKQDILCRLSPEAWFASLPDELKITLEKWRR